MNNAEIEAIARYTVTREMEFIGRLLLDSSEFESIDFESERFFGRDFGTNFCSNWFPCP